jgi:hypothetical protein
MENKGEKRRKLDESDRALDLARAAGIPTSSKLVTIPDTLKRLVFDMLSRADVQLYMYAICLKKHNPDVYTKLLSFRTIYNLSTADDEQLLLSGQLRNMLIGPVHNAVREISVGGRIFEESINEPTFEAICSLPNLTKLSWVGWMPTEGRIKIWIASIQPALRTLELTSCLDEFYDDVQENPVFLKKVLQHIFRLRIVAYRSEVDVNWPRFFRRVTRAAPLLRSLEIDVDGKEIDVDMASRLAVKCPLLEHIILIVQSFGGDIDHDRDSEDVGVAAMYTEIVSISNALFKLQHLRAFTVQDEDGVVLFSLKRNEEGRWQELWIIDEGFPGVEEEQWKRIIHNMLAFTSSWDSVHVERQGDWHDSPWLQVLTETKSRWKTLVVSELYADMPSVTAEMSTVSSQFASEVRFNEHTRAWLNDDKMWHIECGPYFDTQEVINLLQNWRRLESLECTQWEHYRSSEQNDLYKDLGGTILGASDLRSMSLDASGPPNRLFATGSYDTLHHLPWGSVFLFYGKKQFDKQPVGDIPHELFGRRQWIKFGIYPFMVHSSLQLFKNLGDQKSLRELTLCLDSDLTSEQLIQLHDLEVVQLYPTRTYRAYRDEVATLAPATIVQFCRQNPNLRTLVLFARLQHNPFVSEPYPFSGSKLQVLWFATQANALDIRECQQLQDNCPALREVLVWISNWTLLPDQGISEDAGVYMTAEEIKQWRNDFPSLATFGAVSWDDVRDTGVTVSDINDCKSLNVSKVFGARRHFTRPLTRSEAKTEPIDTPERLDMNGTNMFQRVCDSPSVLLLPVWHYHRLIDAHALKELDVLINKWKDAKYEWIVLVNNATLAYPSLSHGDMHRAGYDMQLFQMIILHMPSRSAFIWADDQDVREDMQQFAQTCIQRISNQPSKPVRIEYVNLPVLPSHVFSPSVLGCYFLYLKIHNPSIATRTLIAHLYRCDFGNRLGFKFLQTRQLELSKPESKSESSDSKDGPMSVVASKTAGPTGHETDGSSRQDNKEDAAARAWLANLEHDVDAWRQNMSTQQLEQFQRDLDIATQRYCDERKQTRQHTPTHDEAMDLIQLLSEAGKDDVIEWRGGRIIHGVPSGYTATQTAQLVLLASLGVNKT